MDNRPNIDLPSYTAGARMMLLRLISNGVINSTPRIYGANEKMTQKERKRFVDSSLVANLLRDGRFLEAFLLEKPIVVNEVIQTSNGKKIKTVEYRFDEE